MWCRLQSTEEVLQCASLRIHRSAHEGFDSTVVDVDRAACPSPCCSDQAVAGCATGEEEPRDLPGPGFAQERDFASGCRMAPRSLVTTSYPWGHPLARGPATLSRNGWGSDASHARARCTATLRGMTSRSRCKTGFPIPSATVRVWRLPPTSGPQDRSKVPPVSRTFHSVRTA